MNSSLGSLELIVKAVSQQPPFSSLSQEHCKALFSKSQILRCSLGQRILRPDTLPEDIHIVIQGKVRLLAQTSDGSKTIDLRGSGQLIGWISLLRASPCEWIIASEDSLLLSIPSDIFVKIFEQSIPFQKKFSEIKNLHEVYDVIKASADHNFYQLEGWQSRLDDLANQKSWTQSIEPGVAFKPSSDCPSDVVWIMSSDGVPNYPPGYRVLPGESLPTREGFKFPYRLVGLLDHPDLSPPLSSDSSNNQDSLFIENPSKSLQQLGILEADNQGLDDKYPFVKGVGSFEEILAISEMVALQQEVPFRRDSISKLVEGHFRRNKPLTLELMASLQEVLGLNCQLANVDKKYFLSIEAPAIFLLEEIPVVLFSNSGKNIILGHPHKGLISITEKDLQDKLGDTLRFALPRRIGTTPRSRFGWSWFTPLISKYRKSLILVFAASLFAQLFGLMIPLLIQQIIDKVLTQGNLSSLNVLGSVMILLALFQGLLTALRTYIFVDTTDRMDLTLGTAVIDRLLALPLSYFEKRPVGELSQRLGELNTIRGFLTGTALVSVLNIIFALLYLAVMLVYSPFLTAVALSTLPIYVLMVFLIAPIYKNLIRKRAVAQARTQSHLIEVLGGIQTVKAQHFELTARWKWQDRYRHFVSEGFKATALGATSGEIGGFLNQFSSLLVLWIGMGLVLEGQLTLGMLIAFRIISGKVTSPLLQLSGLYQGFQKVQLSMERLSDILDQNPELSAAEDVAQISMPPISGNIRFESVSFRFADKGPYQVDDVSLNLLAGSFVGIVGQSGSGKSTLTKLIPKLYSPDQGRIFIDNYDVSKVNLSSLRRQIGIVPQDSLLFEGTVAENIALNDPQATNDSIIEAAKIACAHEFIMSLGQGYATPLAERGSNLSGGQRQRIAIARTVLANPQLLVMDEATSALDYSTERQLCLNLQDWASGRTVLFITHRLSSIRNSDHILVMDSGKLVEEGTHQQLMNLNQRYAALFDQQGN
ncbi:ABC transporter transmembrane domain-containing protein [Synechococcus sp. BL107]|uniref:ABC transporter transmembrane domain-containing protein n=1 Tax=Synechococcus sp. BL107 TaxID=313625 RepID=UPI000308E39F|nr:ABC transporter transmembrane domain-containing protein [Synechococcus sp. BL107]